MPLQLDDLAALDEPSPTASGQPLLLPVADRHRYGCSRIKGSRIQPVAAENIAPMIAWKLKEAHDRQS